MPPHDCSCLVGDLWSSPRPQTLSCFAGEPNTLFRSNSLASKSMESFLKVPHHPKPALPRSPWPWAVPTGTGSFGEYWEGWWGCVFPWDWEFGEGPLGHPYQGVWGCRVPNLWPCPPSPSPERSLGR